MLGVILRMLVIVLHSLLCFHSVISNVAFNIDDIAMLWYMSGDLMYVLFYLVDHLCSLLILFVGALSK